MATGQKVKFYISKQDNQLINGLVDFLNRRPENNFTVNSLAKLMFLEKSQELIDEIRTQQAELRKQLEEQQEKKASESEPQTEQAGDENIAADVPVSESQELSSGTQT